MVETDLDTVLKNENLRMRFLEACKFILFYGCDAEIAENFLKQLDKKPANQSLAEYLKSFQRPKVPATNIQDIKTLLDTLDIQKTSYLDISSHECTITNQIAAAANVTNTKITLLRVPNCKHIPIECDNVTNINLDFDNKVLPVKNNTYDLITCIYSLHHFQNAKLIASELFRIMMPGGHLLIRENNCCFPKLDALLRVLHEVTTNEVQDCNFHSAKYWDDVLNAAGFRQLKIINNHNNPGERFHALYEKPGVNGGNIKKDNKTGAGLPSKSVLQGKGNVPKDAVAASMIKDTITECSMISKNDGACSSDQAVNAINNILGSKLPISNKPEDRKKIIDEAKHHLHCDSERCVITHADVVDKLGDIAERELKVNFKVKGPTDVTLLNNYDIDHNLKQWQVKFKDFYANDFNMVDYDGGQGSLSTTNMADFYDDGFKTFGCVINSDVYAGRGKHWMALFVDMRSDTWTAEFFNSSGNPPVESWCNWLRKTVDQLHNLRTKLGLATSTTKGSENPKLVRVSRIRHQETQTECGVYALYYIWCRLNQVPYKYFQDNMVPDKWMLEMRYHLFHDDRRVEPQKFDYDKYKETTRVLWES